MLDRKRVVIKIGTAVLTDEHSPVRALAKEISKSREVGHEFLIVSSGAIGAGMKALQWAHKPKELREKQAAAAVGQVFLMQNYQRLFEEYKINVAQVLLTRSDFEDRARYLNARHTLLTLLELGVVPVINENDTVSVEEIQFGDNDRLSALVAAKIDADLLMILTNVEGLFKARPDGFNELVPMVSKITPEIEKLAWKGIKSDLGTGGMASKIEAAKIATASGVSVVVADAYREGVIAQILQGKSLGTKFIPVKNLTAKERWILFGARPKGDLLLDSGAARAVQALKKSLLAAGILEVRGKFSKGEIVRIKTEDGVEIARGVVRFSSEEVEKIKREKSGEIKKILGRTSIPSEVVHRDSLVVLP